MEDQCSTVNWALPQISQEYVCLIKNSRKKNVLPMTTKLFTGSQTDFGRFTDSPSKVFTLSHSRSLLEYKLFACPSAALSKSLAFSWPQTVHEEKANSRAGRITTDSAHPDNHLFQKTLFWYATHPFSSRSFHYLFVNPIDNTLFNPITTTHYYQ